MYLAREWMMSKDAILLFWVMPLCFLLLAGGLSYWAGLRRKRWGTGGLVAVLLVFALAMLVGIEGSRGIDLALYQAGLTLMAAPAAVGAVIGGVIGWRRKASG